MNYKNGRQNIYLGGPSKQFCKRELPSQLLARDVRLTISLSGKLSTNGKLTDIEKIVKKSVLSCRSMMV